MAGCAPGNRKEAENPVPKPRTLVKEEKEYRVGVVLSENDLGANNGVIAGLIRAKNQLGVDFHIIKPKELATHEDSVRYLAENAYDLVLGVGQGPSLAVGKLAGEYSDVKFATTEYLPQDFPNVAYYDFREQEGGFLAGILAASLTKTNRIAFIGGAENEMTRRYLSGYTQGVNYINRIQKRADSPASVLGSVYQQVYNEPAVKRKTPAAKDRTKAQKDLPKPLIKIHKAWVGYFAKAFNQPEKARIITLAQIDKGVDVIFQVAGHSGQGVFKAAAERGVKIIGTGYNPKEKTSGLIITNVAKNLEETTFQLLKDLKNGKYRSGSIPMGLKENGILLTPMDVMQKPERSTLPVKGVISPELASLLTSLRQQIIAGKIIIKD